MGQKVFRRLSVSTSSPFLCGTFANAPPPTRPFVSRGSKVVDRSVGRTRVSSLATNEIVYDIIINKYDCSLGKRHGGARVLFRCTGPAGTRPPPPADNDHVSHAHTTGSPNRASPPHSENTITRNDLGWVTLRKSSITRSPGENAEDDYGFGFFFSMLVRS